MKNLFNKKIIISVILISLVLVLNGCKETNKSEVYKNEEYGFAFKIPNNWEGKYKIEESEGENYNRVSFLYTGYEYEDGSFQEFFSIMVLVYK